MKSNPGNTIGAGGEASAMGTLRAEGHSVADLNTYRRNFDAIDVSTDAGVASVKTRGVGSETVPLSKYEGDLRNLVSSGLPGTVPVAAEKAARSMASHQADLAAKGAWPKDLPTDASVGRIAAYINAEARLLVPADHVAPLRDHIRQVANNHPEVFEIDPGAGKDQQIERLLSRIGSSGMTTKQYAEINDRVHARR